MTDPTPPIDAPVTPPVIPVPAPPTDTDKVPDGKLQDELAKWKEMSRKNETAAKANAEKAKAFDAAEEANKTETQKLTDRLTAAEARASEVESRALRAEVAAAKGIPAALLVGKTQEELEASADALLTFRGEKPKPDFGGGDRGDDITKAAAQLTRADLDRMTKAKDHDGIVAAQDAGRFDALLGITSK